MWWSVILALCVAVTLCDAWPANCVPCVQCLDVVLVVDRSSSVGSWRWNNRMLPFLQQFASTPDWTIGTGDAQIQVAAVMVGTDVTLAWNWGDVETDNMDKLFAAFGNLAYSRGQTNTGKGLTLAKHSVLDSTHNRKQCTDICIVISAGAPNAGENTKLFNNEFGSFKAQCDKVIAVGITTVPDWFLNALTVPQYQIHVSSFNVVAGSFDPILEAIFCK